jgi:hypothetical protein
VRCPRPSLVAGTSGEVAWRLRRSTARRVAVQVAWRLRRSTARRVAVQVAWRLRRSTARRVAVQVAWRLRRSTRVVLLSIGGARRRLRCGDVTRRMVSVTRRRRLCQAMSRRPSRSCATPGLAYATRGLAQRRVVHAPGGCVARRASCCRPGRMAVASLERASCCRPGRMAVASLERASCCCPSVARDDACAAGTSRDAWCSVTRRRRLCQAMSRRPSRSCAAGGLAHATHGVRPGNLCGPRVSIRMNVTTMKLQFASRGALTEWDSSARSGPGARALCHHVGIRSTSPDTPPNLLNRRRSRNPPAHRDHSLFTGGPAIPTEPCKSRG